MVFVLLGGVLFCGWCCRVGIDWVVGGDWVNIDGYFGGFFCGVGWFVGGG